MRIIDQGIAAPTKPGTDHSSHVHAWNAVLDTGRWVVGYRAAATKNDTLQSAPLRWSDDQGKTWSDEVETPPAPTIDGCAGQWRAAAPTALGNGRVMATLYWVDVSDPGRPFFNTETEGLLDSRIFFSISDDGGETWSVPRQVDCGRYRDQPTPITGPMLLLPDGTWAFQFELNKPYLDPKPWRHAPCLVFSRDQGETFEGEVETAAHPNDRIFYWDQRPVVLADGAIFVPYWTYDLDKQDYLTIHATHSDDGGKTWAPLWDTGVSVQPGMPSPLPDGSIAMPYVDRTGVPTIKWRQSFDGGRTFPDETEAVIHVPEVEHQLKGKARMQDAWDEMGKYSVGLPQSSPLPDGDVLVTWYTGRTTDETSIAWARVSP